MAAIELLRGDRFHLGAAPRLHAGLGLRQLVVFMNRCDEETDLELLDLAEQETRELLGRCGFAGDSTPVIRGSALRALAGDEAVPRTK